MKELGIDLTCLTLISISSYFDQISAVIGIIASVVVLAFNIWKWVKAAKADGKITKEEIEELQETVVDGLEDLNDKINKGDK